MKSLGMIIEFDGIHQLRHSSIYFTTPIMYSNIRNSHHVIYVLHCRIRHLRKRKTQYGSKKHQPETNPASTLAPLLEISSVQHGTKVQRQMPWHNFLECKTARDHLQIMNHDHFGYDEVQSGRERKHTCYLSGQCPIK